MDGRFYGSANVYSVTVRLYERTGSGRYKRENVLFRVYGDFRRGSVVFALFSYPAHILPVKVSLTCYPACLATLLEGKIWRVRIKNSVFSLRKNNQVF
jgi:hypothetical protein